MLPLNVPPDQDRPAVDSGAQVAASHAVPKMSCSPWSTDPSAGSTTQVPALEASMDPRPLERGAVWVKAGTDPARTAATAAATSMTPAPWTGLLSPGSRSVVLRSRPLTWSGVSRGSACRSSATAPETTAADCEVPVPRKKRPDRSPVTRPSGCWTSAAEPGTRRLTTDFPGASTSGRRASVPALVHAPTRQRDVSSLPRWSEEPTAMTYGSAAGMVSGSTPDSPSLPAATTTTTPACQALSTAWASGSSRYGWVDAVP